MKTIKRGDIYTADLNPTIGSEQNGVRPVLVIQCNSSNQRSPTVVVAAITSRVDTKAAMPIHHVIQNTGSLQKPSVVLLEQIRTIDKTRLRTFVGSLDENEMCEVDRALSVSVGLEK